MKTKRIAEILELYGLERILEDNLQTLTGIIDILVELGYLDLDMYDDYPVDDDFPFSD